MMGSKRILISAKIKTAYCHTHHTLKSKNVGTLFLYHNSDRVVILLLPVYMPRHSKTNQLSFFFLMWHMYGPFTVSSKATKNNSSSSTTCRLSAFCISEELLLQLYLIFYNLRMCKCTVSWNTKFILPSLSITNINGTKNPINQNYSLNFICPITMKLTLAPVSRKACYPILPSLPSP